MNKKKKELKNGLIEKHVYKMQWEEWLKLLLKRVMRQRKLKS
jgi:hypothetical protein